MKRHKTAFSCPTVTTKPSLSLRQSNLAKPRPQIPIPFFFVKYERKLAEMHDEIGHGVTLAQLVTVFLPVHTLHQCAIACIPTQKLHHRHRCIRLSFCIVVQSKTTTKKQHTVLGGFG